MPEQRTDREARHRDLAARFLPDALLERIRARAADDDRENRFFTEDLAELRAHGYLTLFVPESLGGAGLGLAEVSRLQQRLATAAPATALALNMHLMCTGAARALVAVGDDSLSFVFEEAAAGEIFAFGISEAGNDLVLQGSNTVAAAQPDGGYLLTGVKIFTSLSPVWTRLISHGLDAEAGELVYGFLERGTPGIEVSDSWNTLGMRPSHSRATILREARVRPERVVRRIAADDPRDTLIFTIASHFQLMIASVYAGVAARGLTLAAESLGRRRSGDGTLADSPEYRARIADAHLAFLPVPAQIELLCRDIDELADHGAAWSPRLIAARLHAGDAARRNAELALYCAGGSGFGAAHEAGRLVRDAAASMFHPPSADAARPMFAAALLDE